jgi:hypothetical protein
MGLDGGYMQDLRRRDLDYGSCQGQGTVENMKPSLLSVRLNPDFLDQIVFDHCFCYNITLYTFI